MNIREIEETIHTLETRHPGLNEVMLMTLLKAGGWEDKDIETAKMLFRSTPTTQAAKNELAKTESLPATQEAPLFEPVPDNDHLLESPHEEAASDPVPAAVEASPEPVSLVEQDERMPLAAKEELPHNLPLRPFETSEHIWPFSRYKDVFFGEDQHTSEAVVEYRPAAPVQNIVAPTQVVVNIAPSPSGAGAVVPAPPPQPVRIPDSIRFPEVEKKVVIVERTGDEKLVIMAGIMLLAILLLLGYMYSNGRL